MDLIFIIELAIVAVIVVIQFVTFFKNNSAIRTLGEIFPDSQKLQTKQVTLPAEKKEGETTSENQEVSLIVDNTQFNVTFREIIKTINIYLARQKGDASEDTIKELAEAKVTSHEKAIESNIAMPLYIGLLCTFAGVIIGLVRIATDGVSDYAIQSFIGGVLIGMIGSANGLALTVRSNFMFKEKKKVRDQGQYDFFNFLRAHFLPEGFAKKSAGFNTSHAKENLEIFHEGFVKYQQHMNLSLSETLQLFSELKGVFAQIKSMEMGLKGINQYLHTNENIVIKQVASIEQFNKRAELISSKLNEQYANVEKQLASLAAENIKALDRKTQLAYSSMNGNGNGYHHGNGNSLAYAEAIDMDLSHLRDKIKGIEVNGLEINQKLIKEINESNQTNQKTSSQISLLNNQLAKILEHQEANYLRSKEFRFFIWTGVTAFLAGISGAIIYVINTFL
ncbi:MAG: hypothetical protein KDD99_00635 [Bacteroidetes bacterium]|nr:hypothetical protein [Bacteroidota bacterium]